MKVAEVPLLGNVLCPADRGTKPFVGLVLAVSEEVNKNIYGVEYVWVTVRETNGRNGVWPSNRLGRM